VLNDGANKIPNRQRVLGHGKYFPEGDGVCVSGQTRSHLEQDDRRPSR